MRTFMSIVLCLCVGICFGGELSPEKIPPPKGEVPKKVEKKAEPPEERVVEHTFSKVCFEIRGDFLKVTTKGDKVQIYPLKAGGKISITLWNARDYHRKVVLVISENTEEGKPPGVQILPLTIPAAEDGKWAGRDPVVITVQPDSQLTIVIQGIGLDEI